MIVSHRHRFVYVQVPQTGSTALGHWMVDHLEGLDLLRKHTTLAEAHRVIGGSIDDYLVVASVRDSIEQFVSSFYKIVRDSEKGTPGRGRIAKRHVRTSWAAGTEATLDGYVDTFVRRVHAPVWALCIRRADVVIRYETIDADVAGLAMRLGVTDAPEIPIVNTTPRPPEQAQDLLTVENFAKLSRFHQPFRSEFGYSDRRPRRRDRWSYEASLRLKALRRRRNDSILRGKISTSAAGQGHRDG